MPASRPKLIHGDKAGWSTLREYPALEDASFQDFQIVWWERHDSPAYAVIVLKFRIPALGIDRLRSCRVDNNDTGAARRSCLSKAANVAAKKISAARKAGKI